MKIKRAIPPELIIWENVGLNKKEKRVRILLISLLSFFMLTILFVLILFLET